MISYSAVVTSLDLLTRILDSGEKRGWFGGYELVQERLLIGTSILLNGEVTESEIPDRLVPHRASDSILGMQKDKLLEWFVAEEGFRRSFRIPQIVSKKDFCSRLPVEISADSFYVAVVEPSENGPLLTTIYAWVFKEEELVLFPSDSIIQTSSSSSLARASKELVNELKSKSVMIVGIGSGGSEIALTLASAGIGKLHLVDMDRLYPENYIRFPGGRMDLGRTKVNILASAIKERELPAEVSVSNLDIVDDADAFRGNLSTGLDLVICAADSIAARRLVNWCCVQLRIPCVLAATFADGKIAEVIEVTPKESACYECIRLELGAVLETGNAEEQSAMSYATFHDGMFVHDSAMRLDIAFAAGIASRVALQILSPGKFPATPTKYIVWGREADHSYSSPFQFEVPMATNYVDIKRRKDCPACGGLSPSLEGVDFVKKAREILESVDQAP